ncbi:DNA polymerase III subunit delta' [Robbsia sp. Bb-Pol-6]|uniref:DNA polymerase III subunit delta n=1 Tax=Robbsia betulipollinis TaxID=2981849 RepID=A0ABT3ZQA9_9BURK|nr:DNA polymerase III subunit delta' [Robbsia betulipollinis]MCY0388115.1 DNA polymerase III subunit delta' [Robbsia betulipollinis]
MLPGAASALYPWQQAAWHALGDLRARWPHALLIHGQAGIGKTRFARQLAKALLCEGAQADARPCGACLACHWFEQGNHPDLRAVFPENLAPEPSEGDASAEATEGDTAARTAGTGGKSGASKAPSKEIKVEQVRSLLEFCGIGAHRSGHRVVLLYPAEALNAASSNALLKTLEEPPEGVVFLIVTSRIERLLPTIVSRCRQWPLGTPAAAPATAWLAAQGVSDAAAALAQAGGAPLAALEAEGGGDGAHRQFVLTQLAAGERCDAFACGETLQKVAVPMVLGWLQRWLYDLLSLRLAGTVRYYPNQQAALARCVAAADTVGLARMNQELARQRATEQHPLNARLVCEALFVRYRELFSGASR